MRITQYDINMSDKSDKEIKEYLERVLGSQTQLDWLHDESPAYRIFSIYQCQNDARQQRRIQNAVYSILKENFVHKVHEKLDKDTDRLLGELAFLAERLKITSSYYIFRSLIDRGSLGRGRNVFARKNTERLILRTLIVLQRPKLLGDSIWRLYWQAANPTFADVAFLGIRRSDRQLAIELIKDGYKRWKGDNKSFNFPQALWELANSASETELTMLSKALGILESDKDKSALRSTLISMGLSRNKLRTLCPPEGSSYIINSRRIFKGKELHVYYHRDMDGIGCAVLLSLFLIHHYGHNQNKIILSPIDHGQELWVENWVKSRLKKPSAILDFLYHKDAIIYYDHHSTSFISNEDENNFNDRLRGTNDKYLRLVKGETSAIKLIFSDLKNFFEEHLPERFPGIERMVNEINKIDSGRIDNPLEWYKFKSLFQKFNLICLYNRTDEFCNKLVRDLIQKDPALLFMDATYKHLIVEAYERFTKDVITVRNCLEIYYDRIILYDAVRHKIPFHRFLPYFICEGASFVIGIYEKKNAYEVSVGKNPSQAKKIDMDIGGLCRAIGDGHGGGRRDVGGITTSSYDEACDKAETVIGLLSRRHIQLPLVPARLYSKEELRTMVKSLPSKEEVLAEAETVAKEATKKWN